MSITIVSVCIDVGRLSITKIKLIMSITTQIIREHCTCQISFTYILHSAWSLQGYIITDFPHIQKLRELTPQYVCNEFGVLICIGLSRIKKGKTTQANDAKNIQYE